jgi:hypothetical protein
MLESNFQARQKEIPCISLCAICFLKGAKVSSKTTKQHHFKLPKAKNPGAVNIICQKLNKADSQ